MINFNGTLLNIVATGFISRYYFLILPSSSFFCSSFLSYHSHLFPFLLVISSLHFSALFFFSSFLSYPSLLFNLFFFLRPFNSFRLFYLTSCFCCQVDFIILLPIYSYSCSYSFSTSFISLFPSPPIPAPPFISDSSSFS